MAASTPTRITRDLEASGREDIRVVAREVTLNLLALNNLYLRRHVRPWANRELTSEAIQTLGSAPHTSEYLG